MYISHVDIFFKMSCSNILAIFLLCYVSVFFVCFFFFGRISVHILNMSLLLDICFALISPLSVA